MSVSNIIPHLSEKGYNNDKTIQQKLRKIQATEASQRNDGSGKGTMETDQKQTA